jgi:hypothetical protein
MSSTGPQFAHVTPRSLPHSQQLVKRSKPTTRSEDDHTPFVSSEVFLFVSINFSPFLSCVNRAPLGDQYQDVPVFASMKRVLTLSPRKMADKKARHPPAEGARAAVATVVGGAAATQQPTFPSQKVWIASPVLAHSHALISIPDSAQRARNTGVVDSAAHPRAVCWWPRHAVCTGRAIPRGLSMRTTQRAKHHSLPLFAEHVGSGAAHTNCGGRMC